MELLALRSNTASYNAFTSLIGLEAVEHLHELALAVPLINTRSANGVGACGAYSVLFHEVAHQWCMRTSLLGCVLSVATAKAWNTWTDCPTEHTDVSSRAFHLLGTWVPILEGLATYAQLDYVANEDVDVIHSPVLKVAQFVSLSIEGIPNRRLFNAARRERLWTDRLLRVLLVDAAEDPREHAYLVGYLYVKALAHFLAKRSPRLARPAIMLPLLIRVLCEHPVILQSQLEDMSSERMLDAVHQSLRSLDASLLEKIADWVEQGDPNEVVWKFDFLDVHASQACGDLTFSDESAPWYDALDAATPQLRSTSCVV